MISAGGTCIRCRDLGRMEYAACRELQLRLFDALTARKRGTRESDSSGRETASGAAGTGTAKGGDSGTNGRTSGPANALDPQTPTTEAGTILLVEHPPVYTLGKSGREENLLVDSATLERLGARFYRIERGGDITFHGPGQLVCYPILDLERLGLGLRAYIAALEEAVIRTVAFYGIRAGRVAGASGVWIGSGVCTDETGTGDTERGVPRKICAIGVRSSRYVTMHGFALNVSTDLAWFSRINPCGFTDRGVTSMEAETGHSAPMEEVKDLVLDNLSEILNVRIYK